SHIHLYHIFQESIVFLFLPSFIYILQLVAVHDILTNSAKRVKYHQVLEHGLPDWRQAVYYYRRVRKMGLIEMSIILFIIITIGQYLVAWAAYFEKKYTLEEYLTLKSKKLQKKQKKGKIDGSIEINPELVTMQVLSRPSVSCTLPIQICKLVWFLVVEFPPLTYYWTRRYFEERQKRKEEALQEESEEEEEVLVVRERGPRRRKAGFTVPEMSNNSQHFVPHDDKRNGSADSAKLSEPARPPIVSGGLWTDDDFMDLIRLMKKYPPGTSERWEKIGDSMRRPAAEVAHMAHKMKDDGFKPVSRQEEENEVLETEPKKLKTRGAKVTEEMDDSVWSQIQQKAFEAALAKFTKANSPNSSDRWEKIAKLVPDKTKEECILRYKMLVNQVKKKKEKENTQEQETLNEV
ncbi:hypothetical protein AAG570_009662, partial [Ranatra chinensis]